MESIRNITSTMKKRLKIITVITVVIISTLLMIYAMTRRNNRTSEIPLDLPKYKETTTETTTVIACPKECYVPLPIPTPK